MDHLTEDQKRNVRAKMKELKLTSRQLADSAFTTYFGIPAFHAYGNGNTKPSVGGINYGQYLKTHNINPHSGDNKPQYTQVYAHAMLEPKLMVRATKSKSPKRAEQKALQDAKTNRFVRKPNPPRQATTKRILTLEQLQEQKARNPITAEQLKGKHNVPIIKPTIKPDNEIAQKMLLQQHAKSVASLKMVSRRSNRAGD